ncbi:MAG: FAD-binding oxidoreductase [Thermoplasmata archaeon]
MVRSAETETANPIPWETIRDDLIEALGANRVLWRPADLLPYAADAFSIDPTESCRRLPHLVVLPESTAEVQKIVRVAAEHRAPLIPKGGGSNRTGMLIPIEGGIVVDTIRMNKVVEVSTPDLYVTVQPGITLKELETYLARHGLALHQVQGSFKVATVGGAISTAAFSRKYQKYGTIADRVMSLEVVLADGRVLRTGPKVLYTSTGYGLRQLFIGAEGTLGIITEATLRVEPLPESRGELLAFYDDFWKAYDSSLRLAGSSVTFVGAEVGELSEPAAYGSPPGKTGFLVVAFEGTKDEVTAEVDYVKKIVQETGGVLASREHASRLIGEYTSQWCGDRALMKPEDEIIAYVPAKKVREFYESLWKDIMLKYGMTPVPGNRWSLDIGRYAMTYCRFFIPERDAGWDDRRKALTEVARLATRLGGSISACTGVGLKNRDDLVYEFSAEALATMWKIKRIVDPDNIMNPGKKLPMHEMTC